MNPIVHFEIQADDIARAAGFYEKVFGWNIERWNRSDMDYWIIMTTEKESKEPGINGGMLKRPLPLPEQRMGANAFVYTIKVDDFDEAAKKIIAAGGKVAMPKFALPGMAWQGYFLDTEGNTFGLHEPDLNAK